MSLLISKKLFQQHFRTISKEAVFRARKTIYNEAPYSLVAYQKQPTGNYSIPFCLWDSLDIRPPPISSYPSISFPFHMTLYETAQRDQQTVAKKSLELLKDYQSLFLALRTGFGKSLIAVYLIHRLGLRAGILLHREFLLQQWKTRIEEYCGATTQIIRTNSPPNRKADIYLIPAASCGKMDYRHFLDIGVLVVDEAHCFCNELLSASLRKIHPAYTIGLSATPDREDGMHKLLYAYFGPLSDFIRRTEVKTFDVIKHQTPFVPELSYNQRGDLDWTQLQNSLAYDTARQSLILEIVMKYCSSQRVLLVSKRQNEAHDFVRMLREKEVNVDYMIGSKNNYSDECRVLVGTVQKIGVGMDDPTLTVLVLASDVKDIRQTEGRIRKRNITIVDVVDDFRVLESHWKIREKWYRKRGATIHVTGANRVCTTQIERKSILHPEK